MILRAKREDYWYRFRWENLENESGMYLYFCGTTYPDPKYYVERTVPPGLMQGGMYVLEYVESGRGTIEMYGKKTEVGAGTLFLLNRMTVHRYYADPADPFKKHWLSFTGPLCHAITDILGLQEKFYAVPCDGLPYFRRIIERVRGMNDANRLSVHREIAEILLHLFDLIAGEGVACAAPLTLAERIKQYIDNSEAPELYLGEIAERFQITKTYLIRVFHERYGITPHRYITERKIESARAFFDRTDARIAEVAQMLGFGSPQYFSRVFRECVGVTPGEYRKMRFFRT